MTLPDPQGKRLRHRDHPADGAMAALNCGYPFKSLLFGRLSAMLARPRAQSASTRTARAHGGASPTCGPISPTTIRILFGGSAGHGVYPSVSTTVTAGRGRS